MVIPVALTRVFAPDGRLVADGGHVGAAVTVTISHVEVDREPVHLRPDTVVVVELLQATPGKTGPE